MSWKRINKIFEPTGDFSWSKSHAQVPVPIYLKELDVLRVFFSTRDLNSRTNTSFVDLSAKDPSKILYVHDKPVMELGEIGAFDDCGVMASCVIKVKNELWMYYIGWNVRNTIPFHNSIGLAVSDDNGLTFKRKFAGPVIDRNHIEPFFAGTIDVKKINNKWFCWYLSCTEWRELNGKMEPRYHIKIATSFDGINWLRKGTIALDYENDNEAGIANASIEKLEDGYKMYYCSRNFNYRIESRESYKIKCAKSDDGIIWNRINEDGLLPEYDSNSWDSQMTAYPNIVLVDNKKYMFYNGNEFGKNGFGYAIYEG
jgi:hypothetical protein